MYTDLWSCYSLGANLGMLIGDQCRDLFLQIHFDGSAFSMTFTAFVVYGHIKGAIECQFLHIHLPSYTFTGHFNRMTRALMELSDKPITWLPNNAGNHADAYQELKFKCASNIRIGGNAILVTVPWHGYWCQMLYIEYRNHTHKKIKEKLKKKVVQVETLMREWS